MAKIKIVAVSYYNTLPMLYGLEHSKFGQEQCNITLAYPAECARLLIENCCDIALVPVGAIPKLNKYNIVSNFCIGANSFVRSVLLISDVPINQISHIYLDYQSATSVKLVKILAEKLWKISPKWIQSSPGYENKINGTTAGVIIGDRCFTIKPHSFVLDLAHEWIKLTNLPFVFAAWLSTKEIDHNTITELDNALSIGINNISTVINHYQHKFIKEFNPVEYYTKNINYHLDNNKRKAMNLFLSWL